MEITLFKKLYKHQILKLYKLLPNLFIEQFLKSLTKRLDKNGLKFFKNRFIKTL